MEYEQNTALVIAKNLRLLMEYHELSQAQLAKKTGVAQRTLSTILKIERPLEINPTTKTLDALCQYFNIASWMLLVPNIPLDLMKSPRITKLIDNYNRSSELGRQNIDRVAESEVRYTSNIGKKPV